MAPVRLHLHDKLQWQKVADVAAPSLVPRLTKAELASHLAFHETGGDDMLQLFETAYEAGAAIEVHAHRQDEIIYILGGTMMLGQRELTAGSSIFVAGGTLYSFAAGAQGLRILNFRPRRDDTFITREMFLAERRSKVGTRAI